MDLVSRRRRALICSAMSRGRHSTPSYTYFRSPCTLPESHCSRLVLLLTKCCYGRKLTISNILSICWWEQFRYFLLKTPTLLLNNLKKKKINRLINDTRKVGYRTYEWLELSNSTATVHGALPRYRPSKLYNNEYSNQPILCWFQLTYRCDNSYTTTLSRTRDRMVMYKRYTYTPCWFQIDAVYPFWPGCPELVSVLQEFYSSSVFK